MRNRAGKIQTVFALALAVLVSGLLAASAADTMPAQSSAALAETPNSLAACSGVSPTTPSYGERRR